jgi:uncharacterized membrane protein YjdF
MSRHDPVVVAWVAGLALAALVFFVGPDHFLFRLNDTLHLVVWRIVEALDQLSATALDVVRALAIGLYGTFMALAFAVLRRGGRARTAIIVVTLLYCVLLGYATPGDQTRWLAALALSGVGAAVMTGRLRQAGFAVRT